MNIEEFSFKVKIKIEDIKKEVINYGNGLAKLNKEMVGGDMTRALSSMAFFGILEDRSRIAQQLNIMIASQQNEYRPFISGEVNRTLKMMMESTTNVMALMKSLMPSGQGSLMPFSQDQGPNDSNHKGATVDDVVKLLKSENVLSLTDNKAQQENLFLKYNIENQPEVNALFQTGMDVSKEGLTMKDLTTLDAKILARETDKIKAHENRRSHEEAIDIDHDEI
jgi:hypothetical protein